MVIFYRLLHLNTRRGDKQHHRSFDLTGMSAEIFQFRFSPYEFHELREIGVFKLDPLIGDAVEAVATAGDASPFATLEAQAESARPVPLNGEADAPTGRLDLVFDVPVCLSVELGRTEEGRQLV